MIKRVGRKPGRNQSCPCGSGKKYKRCHGAPQQPSPSHATATEAEVQAKIEELKARELQREQQQGLGRPIISEIVGGVRFVAVGREVRGSKSWKTFHDFLFDYVMSQLGEEWLRTELEKADEERHLVARWHALTAQYQRDMIDAPAEVHSAPMTGAVAAYLGLAYSLYLVAHNAELKARLLGRLRDADQFRGANYEAYVCAAFIKAGFEIDFEDEGDVTTKHCEFVATNPSTGAKFSVEVKARDPGKAHADVKRQLRKALEKDAAHPRIVFIELNVPESEGGDGGGAQLEEALDGIHREESKMMIGGQPAAPAHVFVTNHPFEYGPETIEGRRAMGIHGFKIPDFRMGVRVRDIREILRMREAYPQVFQLMQSLKDHDLIPSTFDGDIPELAFAESAARLQIGAKYLVPDGHDAEVPGILVDACIVESEKLAYGTYSLEDGRSIKYSCPVTAEELGAYKQHPDTFFGRHRKTVRRIEDPLELFDAFFATYSHSSKEQLLEFMHEWPDADELRSLDQRELAIRFCNAMVWQVLGRKPPE